jgi:hypothetical protein
VTAKVSVPNNRIVQGDGKQYGGANQMLFLLTDASGSAMLLIPRTFTTRFGNRLMNLSVGLYFPRPPFQYDRSF